MGRLIEESRVIEILQQTWLSGTIAYRFIDDIKRRIRIEVPTVEAIPKADYENRLKADLNAILVELQLEIEEIPNSYEHKPIGTYDYCLGAEHERKVNLEIIQQKIDKLKEA